MPRGSATDTLKRGDSVGRTGRWVPCCTAEHRVAGTHGTRCLVSSQRGHAGCGKFSGRFQAHRRDAMRILSTPFCRGIMRQVLAAATPRARVDSWTRLSVSAAVNDLHADVGQAF